ncbi:MAG: hypothetical protein JSV99_10975 [Planctomycetota bacterium]|nr:MAG: hypothetical protein JSV99_10975 [Planctomycetota bacterium]
MQNKPNFPAAQMNVTSFYRVDYENTSNWKPGENKPNQTQYKANTNPIFPDAQMNATSGLTNDYEIGPLRRREKSKPNQTQFSINLSNPKRETQHQQNLAHFNIPRQSANSSAP